MLKRFMLLCWCATSVFATTPIVPCKIQFVKNTCWQPFTVSLIFQDVLTLDTILQLKIDDKSQIASTTHNCKANQAGKFLAKFTPPIWKGDDKVTYVASHVWQIPPQLPKDSNYYEINVCFPDDFQGVPTPTYYFSNCKCPYPETKKKQSD